MNYMNEGHAVKVTREDHKDFNNIGAIIEKDGDFVIVDFGTTSSRHNVSNLLDLTLKTYDHE